MDVVLVTYNSEKWIDGCMKAIHKSMEMYKDLNLYIVDNYSNDKTCQILEKYKNIIGSNNFSIIKQKENLGFGKANNIGAKLGISDIICFINIDTEVYVDTFFNLDKEIQQSDKDVGVWEMRQMPYEHPKLYNPVTRETSWVSGAAFAIKRSVFQKINGFDERIFMYAEDVDLSWRVRSLGYNLKYCPKVMIKHYSYEKENEVKPTQYLESIINNILLRYRFGTLRDIVSGYKLFLKILLMDTSPFNGAKKQLIKKYVNHFKDVSYFCKGKHQYKGVGKFIGWDYEEIRDGAFLKSKIPDKLPLVSIIVRTCQRPEVLEETLISLRNQTYTNVEIIVVEDGEPSAKEMIKNKFFDLNIIYHSTKKHLGRSAVGNIGLEMANGEYINFLDDDDLFFADHIETLVNAFEKTTKAAVYSFGLETEIEILNRMPYKYKIVNSRKRYTESFNLVKLCHHNFIPIQCVMFKKELYDELGGFDTTLDYLEDWDLWVRYLQRTDYLCINKTTSIYRIPASKNKQTSRQEQLDKALSVVRKKHEGYYVKVPVSILAKCGEDYLCQKILKNSKFSR